MFADESSFMTTTRFPRRSQGPSAKGQGPNTRIARSSCTAALGAWRLALGPLNETRIKQHGAVLSSV
jgi:hypothetical protein